EYAQVVSKYLSGTHFIFDPAAYSSSDAILSTNWEINDTDIKEVLRLPYRLAEDRHEKFFLIIDEFQNLDLTDDGELTPEARRRWAEKLGVELDEDA
ncbi:MAG: hypothetical protein IJL80_16235, partial [Treponema sp.]|nr:hypothetical protein [Treponema sp.]